MFGWNVGGPFGALIGAGVGAIAGVVRLFVKGAVEKARQKIKDLYGVDISDKAVLQQIVDVAKQSCGGNLDMAIRTQQVRDLIQLYAMSTGQQTKGMPATVHPLDVVQTGGSLYQSPGYNNGAALPGLGGLPTLDSIGGGVASGAQPMVIQLDGPATTSLLQGQAVRAIASNPRVVQGAVMSASKSNAGRRELTSLQLSPGLVTA
jgi:ABC-type transporter Mla MlaB component